MAKKIDLSPAQIIGASIILLCISLVLLLTTCCVVNEPTKEMPIFVPNVRFIYNTHQLAVFNDLDQDLCGATNKAFRAFVIAYADKYYDYDHIEWFIRDILAKRTCIRYAVIYLK